MIDIILDIDSFGHQYLTLKDLLQSKRLKQHMVIIGVDKSLSNSDLYKHRCLGNFILKDKSSGKFDDKQQYKEIIEDAVVSNPEGFTNNSQISS